MITDINAISAQFDVVNKTRLARATNRTISHNLEAVRGNEEWVQVLASIYPAEGEGFVAHGMFVPMSCFHEVAAVLARYAEKINELTSKFGVDDVDQADIDQAGGDQTDDEVDDVDVLDVIDLALSAFDTAVEMLGNEESVTASLLRETHEKAKDVRHLMELRVRMKRGEVRQ